MPNTIDTLRSHLFDALDALKDKDKPMDLDRARTIADVSKVIIESAKVEVNFLKVTGAAQSTGFLPAVEVPVPRRVSGQVAPAAAASRPAGDLCMLCGIRLTTAYLIERGLCGSCSERPEAQQALKKKPA
jgi:hypothetical protein